ncbi:flagellar basal body P-ring formation chaperone FlgA [Alteromonas sp. 1_MG-2023]|uniref:flagellar basal body P-ring formation chaperone FlgA n=1 Tax=Alteromonas sp. 1_MG-2023 TaxID=3062669 RepID=UPI0026E37E02|nr:flagellar basal body P-ring formation chaperone FlgA [Alteromonas sp. 1_MG-2023]MDO6568472.1 flagellar basal body P-ring formation chaperone FlgA [Alteromonas sp. 1_MG-2023]
MKNSKFIKSWFTGNRLPLFISLIAVVLAPHSYAETMHNAVGKGAQKYLMSVLNIHDDTDIAVTIADVDERINIPQCPTGFQYHASDESLTQSYISVRVSCGNNDWYLFTSAQVTRTKEIVVTSGAVSPGTVLTASNLTLAAVDIKRLRYSAFTDVDALIGARMKRRIVDGQAVQSNMLCFVCKGDRITIRASLGGMAVKTSGIAQQDGVIGDTIKVINASSQKPVIAEVASAQEVVVHL